MLMRPVVRYVTRSPVAPNNPMPSPLPQIEALIEEHQLLKRIYHQRSGEDETAAIGELGEAIAAGRRLCRYSGADGQGPLRGDFPGGCRRSAVDRGRRPVPALPRRQSDGCPSAHERQSAALSAAARRAEPARTSCCC